MTVEIAVLSDTHLPRGGRRLPGRCWERLDAADLIIHAGDFSTLEVLRELQAVGRVAGVHGNVDDWEVRATLPESLVLELEPGLILAVVHDAGPAGGRLERLRLRFPQAAAVIFGHSHIPLHERSPDGFQIFNPGSPTERRRAPRHTMGLARVVQDRISFELVTLD